MPRSAKYVAIDGQFANGVLGTFRILRGFATLQDLAAISVQYEMAIPTAGADNVDGYQRPVIRQHAEDIKRYLERGKERFFPEIILSIRSRYEDITTVRGLDRRITGTKSDTGDGLSIAPRRKNDPSQTHRIKIDLSRLEALRSSRRIRRIDGNHRLHLAAELAFDSRVATKYMAPFCAVLLAMPGDQTDDFVEAMLFHTINSTAERLDSEHALQLLLCQPAQFRQSPDDEFLSDAPLYLTRQLKAQMDFMPELQRKRLGATPATVLNSAATALVSQRPDLSQQRPAMDAFASELTGAITDILARLPSTHPDLCRAEFFVELAGLAWGDTGTEAGHQSRVDEAVKTLEAMGRWLDHDGLVKLQGKRSIAQQLFEIFRSVRRRVPKRVFLSRWYPTDADGDEKRKANLRKQAVDQTLNELRGDGIDLALDDPGTVEGSTFGIHSAMYEALSRNDIILVDLSGVRPNVCIEAGYALKHLESGRMILLFQPTDATKNNKQDWREPPFDLSTFRYEKIADTGEIPGKLKPHLKAIYQAAVDGE